MAHKRFLGSVHEQYPDDDSIKPVYLFAAGHQRGELDRHVLLVWYNGKTDKDDQVLQIIQLTGQPGNFSYYSPVVQVHKDAFIASHQKWVFPETTRSQRDMILRLAKDIKFERKSLVNTCRTFTRDLLERMVEAELLTRELFDEIDDAVPLKRRVPEGFKRLEVA